MLNLKTKSMNNMNKNVFKIFSAWAFVMLFYLVPNLSYGQTFEIEPWNVGDEVTSEPSDLLATPIDPTYEVDEDGLRVRVTEADGIHGGRMYFFYHPEGGAHGASDLVEAYQNGRILFDHNFPTNVATTTFNYGPATIPTVGTYDLFVGHFTGRFDHEQLLTNDDVDQTYGTNSNGFGLYNQSGERKMITKAIDLDGETASDIELVIDFSLGNSSDNPLEIHYNTGSGWELLQDDIYDGNQGLPISIVPPAGAMNANTQFRIRQANTTPLTSGNEIWVLNSFDILRGAPINEVFSLQVGEYDYTDPSNPVPIEMYHYEIVPAPVVTDPSPNIHIFAIDDAATGGDNVWNSNSGNSVDPNTNIFIKIEADDFDPTDEEYNYFINYNGVDYLVDDADVVDISGQEVTLRFEVPNFPTTYNSVVDLEVKLVDGTSIVLPVGGLDENLSEDGTVTGGVLVGNDIDFTQSGTREIMSQEYEITSLDGLSISFDLARLSSQVPPAGQEIIFEFTTDGGVTWTEVAQYELGGTNGVGQTGMSFEYNEDSTQIADIVSPTTQFRIRQEATNNGAGVHTWELTDFELNQPGAGGNVEFETGSAVNFNNFNGDIALNTPSFDLDYTADALNGGPFYPGSTVEVEVDNVSDFTPEGTVVEFRLIAGHINYDASNSGHRNLPGVKLASVSLDDFEDEHELEMPFVDGEYTIVARYVYGEAVEVAQHLFITVQEVAASIVEHSFDFEDDGDQFNIIGREVTVDFELSGSPVLSGDLNLTAVLEFHTGSQWIRIGEEELTTAMVTAGEGAVTGTIPSVNVGAGTRNYRVIIENTPFNDATFTTMGGFTLGFNQTMDNAGERDYEFSSFTIPAGGYTIPTLYIENAEHDQELYFQYINADVDDWTTLVTYEIEEGFTGHLSQFSNLADTVAAPIGTPTGFRFIYNGDEIAAEGENAVVVGRFDIIRPHFNDYESGSESMNVVYPSITLSDDVAGTYFFEEEITVQYETANIDAAEDLWFALVMEQGSTYHVLNESQDLNNVDLNVTFPTEDDLEAKGFNTNNPYNVGIYTYKQDDYDSLVIASHSESFSAIADAAEIAGNSGLNFDQSGDRYTVSPAYDLSDWVGDITVEFLYDATINIVNAQTLPKLEYSIDGGQTYSELSADNVTVPGTNSYAGINRLAPISWTWLTAELPAVSDDVRFRWSQEVATGSWTVTNVNIVAGDDNRFNGFEINYINMPQAITLIEDVTNPYADFTNLNDYSFTLFDAAEPLDPMITVGEDFDFNWSYDPATASTVWPDSTVFEFFIVDGNPNDVENYIPFATVTDTGDFVGNIDELVSTNTYNIYVRASLVDGGEVVWAYPQDMGDETEFDYPLTIVSNELVVNETTDAEVNNIVIDAPANNAQIEVSDLFDVTYTTLGNFPAGVEFAVVLREPTTGEYEVLATGTDFGTSITVEDVQMIAQAWLDDNEDITLDYELGVVAYEGAELILGNEEYALDFTEDLLEVEGVSNVMPTNLNFNMEGDRQALTTALDLSGLENVVLEFDYWANNITMSLNTLPRLEVSIDGGATFDAVEVDDALGAQGYLAANGSVSYAIAIDPAYVTAATHFRWSQAINNGDNEDDWMVSNVEIKSGNANVYINKGQAIKDWINVELVAPTLANYDWSLVLDADGFLPTIFNGGEFDFEWELIEDELPFPTGTEITFAIHYDNEMHVIATIDEEGVHTAEVPFLVERDEYHVYAVDSYYGTAIEDATLSVGIIKVYNEVVRTVYVPENNNLFAGSEVTFEANLENAVDPSDYDDVWFNLVVWDGSDWWLLAAQEGIVNQFVVDLPPFLEGNRTFEIRPSLDGPIGVVGETLTSAGAVIADAGGNIGVANGAVGAYELGDEDLTDYVTLSFELDIEEALANLTADQLINLEYSTDNGQTYTVVASYPDARFNDPSFFTNDDWFMEEINLDADMQQEDVIFRWRVEETNGTSAVRNIEFTPATLSYTNVMSLVKESTNVDILPQRVDITGTDAFEYCLDGTVQMNYQIRGVFGDEAVTHLQVWDGGWQAVEVNGEAVEFTGITSGNGTVALDLADVTSNNTASGTFRLVVVDETVEDYGFTINGNQNEVAIEVVPTFNAYTFGADVNICSGDEVTITVNNAQEHFTYQLRDYVTGDLVGPEVVADLNGALEIELGAITDNWELEVLATAQTENGLVCGTIVPNEQVTITVREESALYWDNDGEWTLVDGTEQLVACANTWTIAVGYYDNDGDFVAIDADFYRNNLNAEVANQEDEFELPAVEGNYFAMFKDCEGNMVQTASVEVIEAYPTPEITVPATASCDADFIELTAPAGFEYYEWRRNGTVFNTNNEASVTVTQGGDYEVRVSNTDACYSAWSDIVTITMEDAYRALVQVDGNWDAVYAGQEVSVCGTVRLGYNNSTSSFLPSGSNGNIVWYRNGIALQGVSTNNFVVAQPGTYQARYVSDNCDYVMEEVVVDFDNVPATPVVAVNGPTDFCEGEASLTLVAPAGFASYEWRRNGGTVVNTASNANEFEVSASGTYTVRVETANGCQSLFSTGVTATVHTLPAIHAATIANQEICEAGEVNVLVPLVESDVMYQLFDVVTGQPSGAARMGTTNANLVLTSDEIESTTMLEVRAYRLNAVDCEAVSQPFEVNVFEMSITASGNTLIANVNNDVNATYQWYRNGVIITNGGNGATLDIYDDADYYVVVSTANGCTLEDGFGKAKGADNDENFEMSVNVFPNPATVDVNVHYTSATEEELTITVLSIEGKVVYQASDVKTEGTFEHVIPVSNLTSGTYMIHINGTESQLVNKFIKQ